MVDRLCRGPPQLPTALRPLVEAAEQTVALEEAKRHRTLWRLAAGGGSVAEGHGLLSRGYHVQCKDSSGTRAQTLAASVTTWGDDPRVPERQVGWGTVAPPLARRPVRRLAVRCRKKNGPGGGGVLLSTLSPQEGRTLPQQPGNRVNDPTAVWLASGYF